MSYKEIKKKHLESGTLFEDKDFPAQIQSIYYNKEDPSIVWRRPKEITNVPKFIVGEASRFDIHQGQIGNCWYIAAAATIATRDGFLDRVVPKDQSFEEGDYAGIFYFNFWRFGKWEEVIIDDQLPYDEKRKKLVFSANKEENTEFWTALLEKAYAKFYGCYEALEGGWTEDAYVDFTGGVGQKYNLNKIKSLPTNFFYTMSANCHSSSLMACSINTGKYESETVLDNGLVVGHAYSITRVSEVTLNGKVLQLVRCRNPWGEVEWNGGWGDRSDELENLKPEERERLEIIDGEDGEFWMSYADWLKNFEQLQICHLPPKVSNELECACQWNEQSFYGSWIKGINAGGCGNPPNAEKYWTNPQFVIIMKETDDNSKNCTLIVSLMQRDSRRLKTDDSDDYETFSINFDIYKAKKMFRKLSANSRYHKRSLKPVYRGSTYRRYREMTREIVLPPGTYVVMPSTFRPDVEMEFYLRFYTKMAVQTKRIIDSTEEHNVSPV